MKKSFEILLVISVLFLLIYSLLYFYYFDGFCNNYTGVNEINYTAAIGKLASCKDSLVCYPGDIEVNKLNEITDWSCNRKNSGFFGIDLYKKVFNNFKDSIIK